MAKRKAIQLKYQIVWHIKFKVQCYADSGTNSESETDWQADYTKKVIGKLLFVNRHFVYSKVESLIINTHILQ